jgi:predicted MPP superfamily phosphohydrolase
MPKMTLPRKAMAPFLLALLLALLDLGLGQAMLLAQGLPGMLWPAFILRMALLAPILPAMALRFWAELHLGFAPPIVLLVWALFLGYATLWTRLRALRATIAEPSVPGRRAFLAGGGVLVASGYGVASAYPAPQISRLRLPLRNLPHGLAGKRLVLLADLHRGPAIDKAYLDGVIRAVNRLQPDIVLLPGDFVSASSAYYADISAVLSKLRPRIAALATLGNHDHWEGAQEAESALARAGVLMLQNRSLHLGEDGRLSAFGQRGLCLAGVDDLHTGKPDLERALAGVDGGVPRILLSHNPDLVEDDKARASEQRVDLQLSGHTHGGQIVLPGVGPIISGSAYGTRYMAGWAQGPDWPVYTTRGIGASIIPVRIGAPPEIVVLDLACAAPSRLA